LGQKETLQNFDIISFIEIYQLPNNNFSKKIKFLLNYFTTLGAGGANKGQVATLQKFDIINNISLPLKWIKIQKTIFFAKFI
jgi:hypothetical protein